MSERQPLTESHPHLAEFLPFLDELNKESARGAVLIAAAYLDRQLEEVVGSFLLESARSKKLLHGFNAPLGTFSARVTAADAFGLISEQEFHDLERIRRIRNDFAHHHRASFSEPSIVQRCSTLAHAIQETGDGSPSARTQFTSAAVALILKLTNRPRYVARRRLTRPSWPD